MEFLRFLYSRESSAKNAKFPFNFLARNYKLSHSYAFDEFNDISSPLSIALNTHLVAVVTECGNICLLRRSELQKVHFWQGHNNAIFDTKWRLGFCDQLLTASGDQSLILWDANNYKKLLKLNNAHKSSIKSVSFGNEHVFASGARDGIIKIWDIRCSEGGEILIPDAHQNNHLKLLNHRRNKCVQQRSDPLNSVTCVQFQQNTNYLYSSGANDASIKLWDLRKIGVHSKIQPAKIFPYLGTTSYTSAHGFTSLVLDSQNRLFANCTDHNIYCYYSNDKSSVTRFVGHKTNNYTKIKILSDKYLISGSTTGNAYLWSLPQNNAGVVQPSYFLPHGTDELTAVDCVGFDFSIYTCSDDQIIKEWKIESVTSKKEKHIDLEIQPFEKNDVEVVNVLPTKKTFTSPPTPLCLITNWLQVKRNDDTTPTNFVSSKKAKSTPKKRISKENKLARKRNFSSKKVLFQQNKKISDYFTESSI